MKFAFVHIPKNAGMSMEIATKFVDGINFYGHDVLKKNIKDFKKIYVVRNPFKRFISAFLYIKHYDYKNKFEQFKTPEDLIQELIKFNPKAIKFLKVHQHFHTVNGKKINTDWVFHPQVAWIDNPYKLLLFERLQEDIDRFNKDEKLNIVLPKVNYSKPIDFAFSKRSVDYLHVIYKEDFELWKTL